MEQTVEQKLKALYELQAIHTKIDKIRQASGLLPVEASDLEENLTDLETRLLRSKNELKLVEDNIQLRKNTITEAQRNIEKYQAQLPAVKNNQEYEAITKEIELQGLDIQISEKKIRDFTLEITSKTDSYHQVLAELTSGRTGLAEKIDELNAISAETAKDEYALTASAGKVMLGIDAGLLAAYTLLRKKAKNGLAIVTVERGACSGCFNQTPAQRQSEIRQHQKIVLCEYCGRILVDEELVLDSAAA